MYAEVYYYSWFIASYLENDIKTSNDILLHTKLTGKITFPTTIEENNDILNLMVMGIAGYATFINREQFGKIPRYVFTENDILNKFYGKSSSRDVSLIKSAMQCLRHVGSLKISVRSGISYFEIPKPSQ